MAKLENVVSHWSTLIPDFNISSSGFYQAVQEAIERREAPNVRFSRVTHREGAGASASREYLRVERRGSRFDVCAAPFGTAFFFSSWLVWRRSLWLFWLGAILVLGTLFIWTTRSTQFLTLLQDITVSFSRDDQAKLRGTLGLFLILLLVHLLFRPRLTYYRLDTMLMFQKTVHACVLEAIDSETSTQGLRALSEEERKPVMREFLRR